jgi:carboxypeptidase PM20D1
MPGVSKPVAMIGIAQKGNVSIELAAESAGGHSFMPPPSTTVGILSSAIARLEDNEFPARFILPIRKMFDFVGPEMPFALKMVFANRWLFGGVIKGQLAASPASNAAIRTTTAPTIFSGGVQENILPPSTRAVVNFRILPGCSVDEVLAHVRDTIEDSRIEINAWSESMCEPSSVSDIDSNSFKTLQKTIHQMFPDIVVAPGLVIGTTDARHYSSISENVYRFFPLRTTSEDLARIHGIDERIAIDNYVEIIQFYVQLIRNSD